MCSTAQLKQQLNELIAQKNKIESKLTSNAELEAEIPTPPKLTDDSGFPRTDIDVYGIRHTRNEIAQLQTDHKNIMKQIETQLHQLHAAAKADKLAAAQTTSSS
jgi:26S proteasome non-ATPase regulatory subunit 9